MRTTRLLLLTTLVLAACSGGDDDTIGVASLEGEVAAPGDDDSGADGASDEGGDEGGDDDPGDGSTTLDETEAQMLEFSACMRDEGVDIGDPVVDADGNVSFGGFRPGAGDTDGEGRPEEVREAFDTCGEYLDGVQLGGPRGNADLTEMQDTLLAFAQCMRDEGVDMDDPDFSNFGQPGQGEGPIGGLFTMLNSDDPDVQAAVEICGDLLAGFGPRVGGPPAGDGDGG